jgi:N-acetylglucosamine kinase-like BadF-type ATPase
MMIESDIERIKRGPNDLEERIEQLMKQKEILKTACKKAGARIKELETELATIKGIGMNSPEMREAKDEIEMLKADLARAKEDHQYDKLVYENELRSLKK